VIVLTGSPNHPLREACRTQGVDEFMLKPFDPASSCASRPRRSTATED